MPHRRPVIPPIPLAISKERLAFTRLYIELHLVTNESIFYPDAAGENDANLNLVAAAVLLGHAEGRAMNATKIATFLNMPRSTVLDRLDRLIARGVIVRIQGRYYFEWTRAAEVPFHDQYIKVLVKAFGVLGPYLSRLPKSDT
jgi:predicted transcriptional regulator